MKRTALKQKQPKYTSNYGKTLRSLEDISECQGCGENLPLTNSHLVPRGKNAELICDPGNIHRHCLKCHDKCETGKYEQLLDGKQIIGYIHTMAPDYLSLKNLKFEPRMNESIWSYFNLEGQ